MEKTIIMIAGCVAGGKTTFSKSLSENLNIPVFNKDIIKAVLGNHIPIRNRKESKQLSLAVFDVMVNIADNLMKSGTSFILESNFRPDEAEILNDIINRYAYNSMSYVFVGDLKVLHKRFIERDNSEERDKANRMGGLLDEYEAFENAVKCLVEFNIGEKVVKVDATDFNKVDYRMLVKEAEDFIIKQGMR